MVAGDLDEPGGAVFRYARNRPFPHGGDHRVLHGVFDLIDPLNVGFVSSGAEAARVGTRYDTSQPGNSNGARPAAAAAAPVKLRKPVFTTVDKLLPQTHGHNLVVRVLSARTILDKPLPNPALRRAHVAECLVGDHTGTVLVSARNQQSQCPLPSSPPLSPSSSSTNVCTCLYLDRSAAPVS